MENLFVNVDPVFTTFRCNERLRSKKKKATHEQDCEVGEGEAKQEIVGGGVHALVPKSCQY